MESPDHSDRCALVLLKLCQVIILVRNGSQSTSEGLATVQFQNSEAFRVLGDQEVKSHGHATKAHQPRTWTHEVSR